MLSSIASEKKQSLSKQFRFGIETEYLLVSLPDYKPLWHKDLSFSQLNDIFESISLEDVPSCVGLELEPPQTKLMPFVVEGYHLPDMDFQAKEILPKGVEIRTPVCDSIEHALKTHKILFHRLKDALNSRQLQLVCLSHHPLESKFSGPQNKRRHDYWQWSMEVMTTYGPDINVGIPQEIVDQINMDDFNAKINYYSPALSALSVASPFCEGQAWQYAQGKYGKSFRMHKRSYIAPPIEIHLDENNRFEFKVFDMPTSLVELDAQILCFLILLLNENLTGRSTHQTRIYELGQVAQKGLQAEGISEKLTEFFANAESLLTSWGFAADSLKVLKQRHEAGVTPADEMLKLYHQNVSLTDILKTRSQFVFE
ncbi:glutamate-cysteine ligase family protein [Pseudobdellovibrio exovorus]|uniref:Glutamate--cysteine ligase n=1 Tax=Pseudobdellovibrio exovorus JSS TaxID=1184267 RepID=M4V9V8_9BACT|nr:glutamate-cysteine ligase family protein [Pseudobdellovibrio exovorus]AGH94816.1 hypothetical protein A11Q_596 [Pseudobdellovibrio exovorus JSS]